ncbi:leucine-rich repeat receptor-like protein kinase [Hibiscus syriacus]|uniref:Leucine-rich repeat receptor-like protein kinase n=1 Tax=Hibiscus syriacus TaxID=106335 RepID=A0A6A2ZBW3_HIBSY|nr:leucine-rich repeat receptor-like protein kinase [Hibiscus syriacus]
MAPNMETKNANVSKPRRLSMEGLQRTISDISLELSKEPIDAAAQQLSPISGVEADNCECCGMSEECTPDYINQVRDKFSGKLVYGLCAEAINEETQKNGGKRNEAFNDYMSACVRFNRFGRTHPALYQAEAMRQILKKSRYTRHITRPSWLSRVFPELERPSLHVEDLTRLLNNKDGFTRMDDVDVVRIWIFDAFPAMKTYAIKTSNDIPRAISWKRKRTLQWEDLLRYTTINNEANTPLQRLTPTEAELATDWWQASKRFFDGTVDEQPPLREPSPRPELSPHPEPSSDRPGYTPPQRQPSPILSHHRASSPPSPQDRRPAKMPRRLSPCFPPPPQRDELGELRDEVNALREEVGTLRKDDGTWRVEVSTLCGEVAALREMVASLQNEVHTLRNEKKNSLLSQHENDYRNAEMAIAMRNENRNDKIAMRNEIATTKSQSEMKIAMRFVFRVAILSLRFHFNNDLGEYNASGCFTSGFPYTTEFTHQTAWTCYYISVHPNGAKTPQEEARLTGHPSRVPSNRSRGPYSPSRFPPPTVQEATVIVEEVPPTIPEPDSHGVIYRSIEKPPPVLDMMDESWLSYELPASTIPVSEVERRQLPETIVDNTLWAKTAVDFYLYERSQGCYTDISKLNDEMFLLLDRSWWGVLLGVEDSGYLDGEMFIPVLERRHWLLVQLQLPSLKIIVYDSMINYISLSDLRDIFKGWSSHLAKFLDGIKYWSHSGHKKPKKFNITVVRDETVPQQSLGARGDCGPLVCLCLARLTTGSTEFLPPTDRDRAAVGLWFRHYMARAIYSRRCLPASAL